MRNVKPLLAVGLTALGSAFVATFKVADAPVATTSTVSTTVPSAAAPTAVIGVTTSPAIAEAASPPATAATPAPTAAGPTTTTTTATWTDGTYSGTAVREPWGDFEVQATIAGGKLVSVEVVAAPTDGHSNRINTTAIPLLTQSALAAQSAQIDTVSGATWTSQSYTTSLQAALDAARAAAMTSSPVIG